jgi:ABC-type iron transport system FetAB ATPase subunit
LAAMGASKIDIDEVGIFDTIGYQKYNNRHEIREVLNHRQTVSLLPATVDRNQKGPVYLIDSKFQTDHITRLISRVKKARLFFSRMLKK